MDRVRPFDLGSKCESPCTVSQSKNGPIGTQSILEIVNFCTTTDRWPLENATEAKSSNSQKGGSAEALIKVRTQI